MLTPSKLFLAPIATSFFRSGSVTALLALVMVLPAAQAAAQCACPGTGKCTISVNAQNFASCSLNLTGRDLEVTGTLQANQLGTISFQNVGVFTLSGTLKAPAGTVDVQASDVKIKQGATVDVSDPGEQGGDIEVTGNTVTIEFTSGLSKARFLADGLQKNAPNSNGTIRIESLGGNLQVQKAELRARGTKPGSYGGTVTLRSSANLEAHGEIDVSGEGNGTTGGAGGWVDISAEDTLTLQQDFDVFANGKGVDTRGGEIALAALTKIKVAGKVDASTTGSPTGQKGGNIRIGWGDESTVNGGPCTVEIPGSLNVEGDTAGTILVRYRQSLIDSDPVLAAPFTPPGNATVECGCARTSLGDQCDLSQGAKCLNPPAGISITAVPTSNLLPCEGCLNGKIEGTEQCDDGNPFLNDRCLPNCTTNECGDGYLDEIDPTNPLSPPEEQCDDGNTTSDDCCSAGCNFETFCADDGTVCMRGKCNSNHECVQVPDTGAACEDTPCHQGQCSSAGVCKQIPDVGAVCDDGKVCTKNDQCNSNGDCKGTLVTCPSDNNECTKDQCVEPAGCKHDPKPQDTKSCGDATCSQNRKCKGGSCLCPDGKNCVKNDGAACDDKDKCSKNTQCKGGRCRCPANTDCVVADQQWKSCDDKSECTVTDLCVKGRCRGTWSSNHSCTTSSGEAGFCTPSGPFAGLGAAGGRCMSFRRFRDVLSTVPKEMPELILKE